MIPDMEGSHNIIRSAMPKFKKPENIKMPDSQVTHGQTDKPATDLLDKKLDKKLTTKIMIVQALVDLKSRKGVSLYAIKKYIAERYNVDTEKLNYHIKKSIKSAVEDKTIIQTKGIGASGSFRLAPVKEKKPKTKKPKKEKTEKTKDPEKKNKLKEKSKKKTLEKTVKAKEKSKKPESKSLKSKVAKENKDDGPTKAKKKKMDTEKMPKEKKNGGDKAKKVKLAAVKKTPSKKKGMSRRKSIGSIIKPPKMKPTA